MTRAASYIVAAFASPAPLSKSRPSRVITDCDSDRLPLHSRMKARSPGRTNLCIFRHTFTSSKPALVRESEAMTRPWRVMMPTQ